MKKDRKDRLEILATREHPIYKSRKDNLKVINAAFSGGLPYINIKLTQFPCESKKEYDARRKQSFLSNYVRRITEQINNHLFEISPKREGISEEFEMDVSLTGDNYTIQDFMHDISIKLTTSEWCWVRVDRQSDVDSDGNKIAKTLLNKQLRGDRIYLSLYDALDVVDWGFDTNGLLEWVLLEQWMQLGENSPFEEQEKILTRTLFYKNKAEVYKIESNRKGEKTCVLINEVTHSLPYPPFLLLGKPSCEPTVFDDLERIQASLLNIESSYGYSLWRSHFALLILPESLLRGVESANDNASNADVFFQRQRQRDSEMVDLIISEGRAITEDKDSKGITRFEMPSGADRSVVAEHIQFLKQEMYDIIGLYMRKNGRDAESAEAKAWDFKTVSAFLANRAELLEKIESKIVELALELDSEFVAYTPFYNKEFGLRNIKEEMETIIMGLSMDVPYSVKKEFKKQMIEVISTLPSTTITQEVKKKLIEELDKGVENTIKVKTDDTLTV